jgi:hypothetical protein
MLAYYRDEVTASQDAAYTKEMNTEITTLTKQIKVDKAKIEGYKTKATNLETATVAQ